MMYMCSATDLFVDNWQQAEGWMMMPLMSTAGAERMPNGITGINEPEHI